MNGYKLIKLHWLVLEERSKEHSISEFCWFRGELPWAWQWQSLYNHCLFLITDKSFHTLLFCGINVEVTNMPLLAFELSVLNFGKSRYSVVVSVLELWMRLYLWILSNVCSLKLLKFQNYCKLSDLIYCCWNLPSEFCCYLIIAQCVRE